MHMYERIHPVRNGTVQQTGNRYRNAGAPVHVVQVKQHDILQLKVLCCRVPLEFSWITSM